MQNHNNYGRRLVSGLLAAALSLSLAAPALASGPEQGAATGSEAQTAVLTGPGGVTYTDVPAGAWYAEAVYYCLNRGLMNGVSTAELIFAPGAEMTRATLATVLYRIEGEPAVPADNPFRDVQADSWYTDAVLWANGTQVMRGYGNGLFGTDDPVTREQMVTILHRYAGSPAPSGTAAGYDDQDKVAEWALDAVVWSQAGQIAHTDSEGIFAPQVNALRCEIAWALMQYAKSLPEPEPSPEPSPEPTPEPTPEPEPDPWEQFEAAFGYLPEKKTLAAHSYDMSAFQVQPNALGYSYMTYANAAYKVGVDVSSWQKDVDWEAVAASGVEFALLRVGFRGYGSGAINRDNYFLQNIEGALDAGLDVGVYFFSQAVSIDEAIEEANYTLKMIRDYPLAYPVVFDWERQSADSSRTKDTSNEMVVACALAFCKTIEDAGYIPMVYAGKNKAYDLEMEYLSDYPFWLAHYTVNQIPTNYINGFDMWQYSSKWSVPGIEGSADVNICLTDWSAWAKPQAQTQ